MVKRSGPPPRRQPLGRGVAPQRRTALVVDRSRYPRGARSTVPPRSAKKAAVMEPRREAAVEKVAAGAPCEVGPVLAAAGLLVRCWDRPAPGQGGWGHHHRRKASDHGCDDPHGPNALWCCPPCNRFVEDHAGEVRARTGDRLVVRPGDPEYVELGRPSKMTPPTA